MIYMEHLAKKRYFMLVLEQDMLGSWLLKSLYGSVITRSHGSKLEVFESLGFNISLEKVQDTLLRHHILWPELSHKLQFMTRQYTREPYYKDEGHGWSVKYMDRLRRYNCLDVCVTYEIYEAQEQEFKERPHLA